jgi:hypothetical protein
MEYFCMDLKMVQNILQGCTITNSFGLTKFGSVMNKL